MVALSKKKRYLVGILILVLIISVGFNLYDYFIISPKMQATINDMRLQAFGSWQVNMDLAAYDLEAAETREDFEQVEYYLNIAEWSVSILLTGIDTGYYPEQYTQNLYYWVHSATHYLGIVNDHLQALLFVNSSALDQYIRLRIENITQAIHSIRTISSSKIQLWRRIGVELIQLLQDEGKLTDVMNYCRQIYETSIEIADYVKDKLQ